MKTFDPRLTALADCTILDTEPGEGGKPCGGILFNPHPVITCSDNEVLTHELCHRFAGKHAYDIFLTAILVRDSNEMFKWVLNALYDWYHENKHGNESTVISSYLMALRENYKLEKTEDPALDKLVYLLNNEVGLAEGQELLQHQIQDEIDLVALADKMCKEIKKKSPVVTIKMLSASRPGGLLAGGGSNNKKELESQYYTVAVSKYYNIIKRLSELWTCNRYDWCRNYFGEINWANLPLLMLGDEMGLPVFRIMSKINLKRKIFLIIDRSGSTHSIKEAIMDTAVIIAESLRRLGTPISILDCGVTDDVVNKINEPLKREWFTPMSEGSTPLGEVLLQIKDDDAESLLIIITDGWPDNWETLKIALNKFKGTYLSCVIGDSYVSYKRQISNVIPVEPHTIIRSLLAHDEEIISQNKRFVRG